jgi:hypothetical protein
MPRGDILGGPPGALFASSAHKAPTGTTPQKLLGAGRPARGAAGLGDSAARPAAAAERHRHRESGAPLGCAAPNARAPGCVGSAPGRPQGRSHGKFSAFSWPSAGGAQPARRSHPDPAAAASASAEAAAAANATRQLTHRRRAAIVRRYAHPFEAVVPFVKDRCAHLAPPLRLPCAPLASPLRLTLLRARWCSPSCVCLHQARPPARSCRCARETSASALCGARARGASGSYCARGGASALYCAQR